MRRALGLAGLVALALAGCGGGDGGGDSTTEEAVADSAAVRACMDDQIGVEAKLSGDDFESPPNPEAVDSFALNAVETFSTAALINVYVFEDAAGAEAAVDHLFPSDVVGNESEQNVLWVFIAGEEGTLDAPLDAAIRTCVTES